MGMLRTEAVEVLAGARGQMLTVVTMQAIDPWNALGQADSRNFNVVGCMGSASAIGLGLAKARSDDRVLVIDGDGALLMQLGSLAAIAGQAPRNLVYIVFENGVYQTSGEQATPGRGVVDLRAIAEGAGFPVSLRIDSLDELRRDIGEILATQGPVFVTLQISGQGTFAAPEPALVIKRKPEQVREMRLALSERV